MFGNMLSLLSQTKSEAINHNVASYGSNKAFSRTKENELLMEKYDLFKMYKLVK